MDPELLWARFAIVPRRIEYERLARRAHLGAPNGGGRADGGPGVPTRAAPRGRHVGSQ